MWACMLAQPPTSSATPAHNVSPSHFTARPCRPLAPRRRGSPTPRPRRSRATALKTSSRPCCATTSSGRATASEGLGAALATVCWAGCTCRWVAGRAPLCHACGTARWSLCLRLAHKQPSAGTPSTPTSPVSLPTHPVQPRPPVQLCPRLKPASLQQPTPPPGRAHGNPARGNAPAWRA